MKILLVEDERKLNEALAGILKQNKYSVDCAYDGEQGLDMALSNGYDCILLDVLMPKMDGITMLKELRAEKINTPVLMLTALSEVHNKIEGFDSGADDYVPKPFSVPELLAHIRALTRRKGDIIQDNSLTFGNAKLNLFAYSLSTDGMSVKLSAKEFDILKYLFERPKFVAVKDDIITAVWGYDGDFESNNLEVYMSFLRKKIAYVKADFTIESVRGVGYQLQKKE